MFALLSLSLALLPFVSAATHDIQVGASGLAFSPEAIVSLPSFSDLHQPLPLSSLRLLVIKSSSTSILKTTQ